MGASNTTQGGNTQFYKLKQEKLNDKMTGKISFARQEKVNGVWTSTDEFKNMSGYFKSLSVKSYEWQGQQKKNLEINLIDDEDGHTEIVISLGFDSGVCRTILQCLSSQENLGVVRFECGEPTTFDGKLFPSLFVKNDGNTCAWKWTEKNGNKHEIPKVENITDEEGNKLKKGVKAATEFWMKAVDNVNLIPKKEVVMSHSGTKSAPQSNEHDNTPFGGEDDDFDSLPF